MFRLENRSRSNARPLVEEKGHDPEYFNRKGSEVVTVLATDTIKIAADKMREHSVAALVVTSGDAIKGLISERDIVHVVSRQGQAALTTTVATIMTHSVVTVTPSDSLRHAMQLMTSHRVRHLPRSCRWRAPRNC